MPSQPYTGQYPVVKKYLEPGDRGTEVTKLQNYLNWYTDEKFFKECGNADGIYGNNTLKYAKQMQAAFFGASEADGLVGPKTINKMKAYSDSFKPQPGPTPGPYSGPYPTIAEIQVASNAGIHNSIALWCYDTAASGKYKYKVWTDDPNTHLCPICHPGSGNGWNCIGFAFASWRHGGGLSTTCNCGVIWNGLGDRYYNMSDAAVLADMKSRIGTNALQLIRNGNRAIPASSLQKGDLLMFYNSDHTYQHMGTYIGNSKIADSTSSRNPNIKYGQSYTSYNNSMPCLFGIRYTGNRSYLKKNDEGVAVTKLQNYVNWYFDGAFFKECGPADGYFGNNTHKWVVKMQTDFFGAKEADGTVGPKTIEKMKTIKK